jgi:hypothetical protein
MPRLLTKDTSRPPEILFHINSLQKYFLTKIQRSTKNGRQNAQTPAMRWSCPIENIRVYQVLLMAISLQNFWRHAGLLRRGDLQR